MPKRKPQILSYANRELPWFAKIDSYQNLFWPIVAVLFVAIVLVVAGVGWASAIVQLLTSGLLLLAWLAAGYGWGAIPRQIFRVRERDALVRVTTIGAGLGILSLLVLGLGLLGWMNQPVSHLILIIGASITGYRVFRQRQAIHVSVPFVHWWWLLLVPLASFTITAAMLPAGFLWGADEPNAYDVVEYHLQVPREWFELGRIVPLTHNVFSFFPFNVEMHYLLAMHVMGGPWVAQFLAQMMHAAFIGLTVAAVYAAVAERGKFVAIMAAVLAASTPWMPMLGAIAYNEGGLLFYGTLAMAWAMRGLNVGCASAHQGEAGVLKHTLHRDFAISGVMAGFACGCKLTAVPMLLLGVPLAATATLIIRGGFFTGPALRRWFVGTSFSLIAGLLFFSPWMIRNQVWARNPVFPEMQSTLGRGHFSQLQSDRFYKAHKPRADQQSARARISELSTQVFRDWRFGYALLPIGIIAMLVSIRRRESLFLLLMLGGLSAFWLLETHLQGRFYVLVIPIAAMAVAQLSMLRLRVPIAVAMILFAAAGTAMTTAALLEFQSNFNSRVGLDVMSLVGATDFDQSAFQELGQDDLFLIGDAKAFWYHLPMRRLHYRTVFDVDATKDDFAIEAWMQGIPADRAGKIKIDDAELKRLSDSYGTPKPTNWASPIFDRPLGRSPSLTAPASAPSR